jgi:hypothetical protein
MRGFSLRRPNFAAVAGGGVGLALPGASHCGGGHVRMSHTVWTNTS